MKALSLDIGTSKICALLLDAGSGTVPEVLYRDNSFMPPEHPWDRSQDPEAVAGIVEELFTEMTRRFGPVDCVGLSSQMHGILYVDSSGRALSPFYTWQDGSGALPFKDGKTCAEYLACFAAERNVSPRCILATGYGTVTHFYRRNMGMVPEGAAKICGIGDYAAMQLCGASSPVMHPTNAGALGFFDPESLAFDTDTLEAAGFDAAILPRIARDYEPAGERDGVPVSPVLGDNQAGFLGSVRDIDRTALINAGTGGQISLTDRALKSPPGAGSALERRPFFEGRTLFSGASLCGGKAYAMLEEFFREVLRMAGCPVHTPLYQAMEAALSGTSETGTDLPDSGLIVDTLFEGTRLDPRLRGAIRNISRLNFTPVSLIRGFLEGISSELLGMLDGNGSFAYLAGSGNGIRRNPYLRRIIEKQSGLPLMIPRREEEAACGAALYGLICAGHFSGIHAVRSRIEYAETENG
jgi:sedoheptulokinase